MCPPTSRVTHHLHFSFLILFPFLERGSFYTCLTQHCLFFIFCPMPHPLKPPSPALKLISMTTDSTGMLQNHQESEHGGPRPLRDVFEVHAEPLLLWGLAAFRRQACITGRCFPKRIGGQLGHQPPVQRICGGKVLLCKRGPTRHRGPQCSPRRNTGVKLGPPPIGFS